MSDGSRSTSGVAQFEEDEFWELSATDMVPDGPEKPYLQFWCPECGTPNAVDYGFSKRDFPMDCVECGESIRIRVSREVVSDE